MNSKMGAGFSKFWDIWYPKKGRGGAAWSWLHLGWKKWTSPENLEFNRMLYKKIMAAARAEVAYRKWMDENRPDPDRTFKFAQGWLSEERYEDDPPKIPTGNKTTDKFNQPVIGTSDDAEVWN
jgi:hypothetical protein